MIKIILADDHQIIIDGIKACLSNEPEMDIIAFAKDGKELLSKVNTYQPDVVLVDIDMPIMNGLIATEKLKIQHKKTKVIILSLHLNQTLIKKCIQLGVDGYLYKDAHFTEIINAINTVYAGKKYFSGEVSLTLAGQNLSSASRIQNESSVLLGNLTKREIEVLQLVAEGLSASEIGRQLNISARTVESHRTNIMQKLNVDGIAGLIKFAVKNGLVE